MVRLAHHLKVGTPEDAAGVADAALVRYARRGTGLAYRPSAYPDYQHHAYPSYRHHAYPSYRHHAYPSYPAARLSRRSRRAGAGEAEH